MHRSRTRQFQEFRTNAGPVRSEVTSVRQSRMSQSSVSQACVNCINQILADRQKKDDKQRKERTRAQFRKTQQILNTKADQHSHYRQSLKKNALDYNSKLIEEQKNAMKKEKDDDVKYAQKIEKNVLEAERNYQQEFEAEKRKKDQYYKQIHSQYIKQIDKKDRQKYRKDVDREKEKGLPLFNPDVNQQKLQYKQELQRQMQEKKRKEKQQRVRNQQKERKMLEQLKQQADKYHADNYEPMSYSKKQVFEGLKKMQNEKKKKAEEDRKAKEQQRMKSIKEENQMRGKAIQLKMKEMHEYVNDLKNQLLEKEEKLRKTRFSETTFQQTIPKSTEQIQAEHLVKKQCRSCHKNYPQQFISQVPRKN